MKKRTMMKKMIAIPMIGMLTFAAAGCGAGEKPAPAPSKEVSSGETTGETEIQEYSTDKITCFAVFNVGGGVDTFGRQMTKLLKDTGIWNGTFIYENVGGASGQVGTTQIVEQYNGNPDYILPTSDNSLQVAYLNRLEDGYGFRDLSTVCRLYCEYRVYCTAPSTGITSLEDLKERASAEDIIGSTSGEGGASHIALAGLADSMGINIRCVPYGDDEDIVATLSGEAHIGCLGSNEAITYIESGDLIPLAVAAPERLNAESVKNVPTCKELGYDIEFGTSRGFAMPGDVDRQVLEYWAGLFEQLYETEEFKQYVQDAGATPAYLGPDEFREANEEQTEKSIEILEKICFYK